MTFRYDNKPRRGEKSFINALALARFAAGFSVENGIFPTTRDVKGGVKKKGFRSTSQIHDSAMILEMTGLLDADGRRRGHSLIGSYIAMPKNYLIGAFFGGEYSDLFIGYDCHERTEEIKKSFPLSDWSIAIPKPSNPLYAMRETTMWLSSNHTASAAVVTGIQEVAVPAIALGIDVYHPDVLLKAKESPYAKYIKD